ncbi:alpha/beta hydrolase [Sphaerisporangium album]|uniref:Alpha/beta hydrolase n=1 Tax=Sphaerisporangium album TaxID=509200 RepID=A0A367F6A7_9ACTN|nr:alpha/beta hydrolase [Sphaerisporangium album]RCG25883.1 alpha/beta hydrolase [Sphaerisporangium album]
MKSSKRSRCQGIRTAVLGVALVVVAAIVPAAGAASAAAGHDGHPTAEPTVVLVHGAWADGSSRSGVVGGLQRDGYTVAVPPNPLRGVAQDSAYLAAYLKTVQGPIVLVGHSYGGFVTTNAAAGNPNVKALVYVDAYIPAQGDTLNGLTAQFPGSRVGPDALDFVPSAGGVVDACLKPARFRGVLAGDLRPDQAARLAAVQRPLAASALDEPSGRPAWATIRSWGVIGTADRALPPAAQEFMAKRAGATITKVNASHLSMISRVGKVQDVIEDAARTIR